MAPRPLHDYIIEQPRAKGAVRVGADMAQRARVVLDKRVKRPALFRRRGADLRQVGTVLPLKVLGQIGRGREAEKIRIGRVIGLHLGGVVALGDGFLFLAATHEEKHAGQRQQPTAGQTKRRENLVHGIIIRKW